jgi:MFS family permease
MKLAPELQRPRRGLSSLWDRELAHYPETKARFVYLTVTVLATIALYYELYLSGAVATQLMTGFGFSFAEFVFVSVLGSAVGAFASLFAGFADRWGRANLVVAGLLVNGLLIAVAVPNASSKLAFTAALTVVGLVEGIALVATPALIRDFSPQSGRGVAMGSWAMGPVLGSLAVTMVTSHTLDAHPGWQFQYRVCGIAGLIVGVIAVVALRELSPALRDQVMVSTRDRALIEARAIGLDERTTTTGLWRQMLSFGIVGPAVSIVLFLSGYFMLVGFLVVYMSTNFGYSEAQANALGNWYWVANATALVVGGVLSDKLRVRKPFMLVGALISMVGTALFAAAATEPDTTRAALALYLVVMAGGSALAYVGWMAAFTETIEKRNPAAMATGLALWGWIVRIVICAFFALLPVAVRSTTTLVDEGPRVAQIVAAHPDQVRVLKTVDSNVLIALDKHPKDPGLRARALAQLSGLPAPAVASIVKHGDRVQRAGDRLAALSKLPAKDMAYLSAHGGRVNRILAAYPQQIAVLRRLDPATAAKLNANPGDTAAQAVAVSQLSGVPVGTVTASMSSGGTLQAAGDRLKSVAAIPAADLEELSTYGTRVDAIVTKYPAQVKVLQRVDAATMTTLGKHPDNTAAQARALAQLSGLPVSTVSRVMTVSVKYKRQLATAQALSPATAAALSRNRQDPKAITAAVAQIARRFGASQTAAIQRLVALSAVPAAELSLMQANGAKVQGAAKTLKSVSAIPAADLSLLSDHGARVSRIATSYPDQVAVLRTVDASTMTALSNDPNDLAAQTRALSALTGLPATTVGAVISNASAVQAAGDQLKSISTVPADDLAYLGAHGARLERISTRYPRQIKTLQQVHASTLRALDRNATDVDAQTSAIAQLTGLSRRTVKRVIVHGPGVQTSGDRLMSLSRVPDDDIRYLAAHGGEVEAAAAANPHQWQRWWWICFAGQLLFIPFIFVLSGRWSWKRAREDELEHERRAARELAVLGQASE